MQPLQSYSEDDRRTAYAVTQLGHKCRLAVHDEINRLTYLLDLILEATVFGDLDDRLPVRSIIDNLTDLAEVNTLVETVPPHSKFFKNPAVVTTFMNCLKYWWAEGFFSGQDSLATVSVLLEGRKADDLDFLGDFEE